MPDFINNQPTTPRLRDCPPCLGAGLLHRAYRVRFLRPMVRELLRRLEGGLMFSRTLRRIYDHYEGVEIGEYTYGDGIRPGVLPRGTKIGRYCSVADGLRVLRRNHPLNHLSQHPFFYNRRLGLVPEDTIAKVEDNPLIIGSDVWIGMNALICPGCRVIGDGAVIAAGSVVTRDVEAFTVVGGNPARPIRKRFSPVIESKVIASGWWRHPLEKLHPHLAMFRGEPAEQDLDQLIEGLASPRSASGGPTC